MYNSVKRKILFVARSLKLDEILIFGQKIDKVYPFFIRKKLLGVHIFYFAKCAFGFVKKVSLNEKMISIVAAPITKNDRMRKK